jgi:2-polyprenyl-6-methoxyphenol hydroxylase-like FAD-dependent oxidoreductase
MTTQAMIRQAMTKRPRKALIIGAGIAGPVTGIFLKRAGFDVQLFEAWPYSTGIGGGLQIAPNGMHVLDEIGLAGEMTPARYANPSIFSPSRALPSPPSTAT